MKKSIVSVGAVLAGLGLLAGVAFAEDSGESGSLHRAQPGMMGTAAPTNSQGMRMMGEGMMKPPKPVEVTITAKGDITLRGTVQSVSSTSLTVKTWGGVWTINIGPSTTLLPTNDLSKMLVGDFVGVIGTVSQDSQTVAATYVRDWVTKPTPKNDDHGPMGSTTPHVGGGDHGMMGSTTPHTNDEQRPPMPGMMVPHGNR